MKYLKSLIETVPGAPRLLLLAALGAALSLPVAPALAQDCNCSPMVQAGNDTPVTNAYHIGIPNGQFIFFYQTYTQPDEIIVKNGGVTLFDTGCVGATGSVTLSYSGPGNITVQVIPNCAGGSGTAWEYSLNWCSFYAGPTCTPTNTPIPFGTVVPTDTPTPTLTPTPSPTPCGGITVSKNILRPGQGDALIHVEDCGYPGRCSLVIFNSAGEHIRTLDDRQVGMGFGADYSWDGKDKYAETCASGVYILRLTLPSGVRIKRLILVR
ncbi:MAG TPA: hypothetical protein VJ873_10185 [bacterium]|nr:hypothetical protein [bacterium]